MVYTKCNMIMCNLKIIKGTRCTSLKLRGKGTGRNCEVQRKTLNDNSVYSPGTVLCNYVLQIQSRNCLKVFR
jgi:hypothetical protein